MKVQQLGMVVLALFCSYLITNYFLIDNNFFNPSKKTPVSEITLAHTPLQSFGLIYIAQELGYFKSENLKINYREFDRGGENIRDLIEQNSDLAVSYAYAFLIKAQTNPELKIISSLHRSQQGTGLVVNNKKIPKLDKLKGKKIGIMKDTSGEYVLNYFLNEYNIKKNQVNMVYDSPKNLITKLESGEIDALSIHQPYLFQIEENTQEKGLFTTYYADSYVEASVLVSNPTALASKEESISRFLKALIRADEFCKKEFNKNVCIEMLSRSLPKTTRESILKQWETYEYTLILDNTLLQILSNVANDSGYEKINYRDSFYEKLLYQLDKNRVKFFDL